MTITETRRQLCLEMRQNSLTKEFRCSLISSVTRTELGGDSRVTRIWSHPIKIRLKSQSLLTEVAKEAARARSAQGQGGCSDVRREPGSAESLSGRGGDQGEREDAEHPDQVVNSHHTSVVTRYLWSNWTQVGFSVIFLKTGEKASKSSGIQLSANLGKLL